MAQGELIGLVLLRDTSHSQPITFAHVPLPSLPFITYSSLMGCTDGKAGKDASQKV